MPEPTETSVANGIIKAFLAIALFLFAAFMVCMSINGKV